MDQGDGTQSVDDAEMQSSTSDVPRTPRIQMRIEDSDDKCDKVAPFRYEKWVKS